MEKLEGYIIKRLAKEKAMEETKIIKLMAETPFQMLTHRVKYWSDAKIIFCETKGIEVSETIHKKMLDARKTIHAYKDSTGAIFKLFSWHKMFPEPKLTESPPDG